MLLAAIIGLVAVAGLIGAGMLLSRSLHGRIGGTLHQLDGTLGEIESRLDRRLGELDAKVDRRLEGLDGRLLATQRNAGETAT
jgi:hypothetical protein